MRPFSIAPFAWSTVATTFDDAFGVPPADELLLEDPQPVRAATPTTSVRMPVARTRGRVPSPRGAPSATRRLEIGDCRELRNGGAVERVADALPALDALEEAGLVQLLQVVRDRGLGEPELGHVAAA